MEKAELKKLINKRADLLIVLGEEGHALIRSENYHFSDKMKQISEAIKEIDRQISERNSIKDMNICPKCNAHLDEESDYCSQCGFDVKAHYATFISKCHFCGMPMKADQKYCSRCGTLNKEVSQTEA